MHLVASVWLFHFGVTVVSGFGTINEPLVVRQHNEHEIITRLAFQCPSARGSDGTCFESRSLDQLAGWHVNVLGIAVTGAGFNGAVGAPDTLDPVPEGPEAHCDDADYLDVPGYPQTRDEANAKLQSCLDHMRRRFHQAVVSANRLLDERHRIRRDMVDLSRGDCAFAFPTWQSDGFGRAKCNAIEGLGRALHGIQDFYSHSNWVDSADPNKPIGVSNPPGLGMNGSAPFLDLRGNGTIPPDQIPRNLTTGCFALPDNPEGCGDCEGRITHGALSKDKGIIHLNGTFGDEAMDPRSEASPNNFPLAVQAAIQHSRETWADFREEMLHQYDMVIGGLMLCALVRDDPVKDCRNRTLAIVVDNSLTSKVKDGIYMEEAVVEEVKSRLGYHGLDHLALIGINDQGAVFRYPMGRPGHAPFDFPQPAGELRIASGLELGIDETIRAQPETYTDRGAILLLATGAERLEFSTETLLKLRRASEEGIRVHYACLSMPAGLSDRIASQVVWAPCSPGDALVPRVLKTGGIAAFIDGSANGTPPHFANLVMDRGLTATDDEDSDMQHTRIYPGITLADFLSSDQHTKSFTYPVTAGERLNFTISSIAPNEEGPEACFAVTLWYEYLVTEITRHTRCGDSSPLSLVYQATESFDLVLEAEYGDTMLKNELLHREEILFIVSVASDMPEKAETTVKKSTAILSSSRSVEIPGVTAGNFLTSETVEVVSNAATVNGRTSTSTESHKASDHGQLPVCRPTPEPEPEPKAQLTCAVPIMTATLLANNLTAELEGDDIATSSRVIGVRR
ncbi:hypothetical protein N658DRAFT_430310 [Parathielavia hyrcaniae]|uniref:VWFA domain-containing protein n=1 Tax=Parathielavia hyrcaniae TaxID=113614 RepID=A0AAN6SZJ1_9PEZI|nr:hypothetical protein N658DRAFT_430310 [Parathielavia hyrcaniae]